MRPRSFRLRANSSLFRRTCSGGSYVDVLPCSLAHRGGSPRRAFGTSRLCLSPWPWSPWWPPTALPKLARSVLRLGANSSSPPPLPKKRAKLFDIQPTWLRDLHHQMQVPKLCEGREEVYSATSPPHLKWPSGRGSFCFASGELKWQPASGRAHVAGTTIITCQKRWSSSPLPLPLQ